jgi:short-subunit dehydrogenase
MNKVILITGASSGIGKETAKRLINQGFTVYGAARRIEKMEDLKELGVHLISMDVTNDASMVAGINKLLDNEKRIDVLVNNAGYGSFGAVEDVPLSEAKYQFEVNLFGMGRLTQLVLPVMRAQHSGRIINISSIAGKIGEPHGAWYHATKFAVEGWSDSLRMELKQFGIDVVIIEPGPIKTEWNTIARENLIKTSGNSAYKELALKHVEMLKKADGKMGAEPIVIAKTIEKAILSHKPKTRYAAGGGASLIIGVRKHVSDRLFDRIMMSQIKW